MQIITLNTTAFMTTYDGAYAGFPLDRNGIVKSCYRAIRADSGLL